MKLRRSRTKTPNAAPSTANQASLPDDGTKETALAQVRQLLADKEAEESLPTDASEVKEVKRERFQSRDFQRAGYSTMTDRYGDSDRALTTITLNTGAQVIIIAGKVASGNPFEMGHAAGGGMDLRQDHIVVYDYDGTSTMKEYLPDGQINTYDGEHGTPAALMPHVMKDMAALVDSERFTQ